MNEDYKRIDPAAWEKKAVAFVTRSYRHLWGKNNEEPLVFLFQRGLKNEFAKKQYLGWNKFAQNRPTGNWGLEPGADTNKTFLLQAGIVVPYILEKKLISVFIYENGDRIRLVPGSGQPALILGKCRDKISVTRDLMDGLFLLQQSGPDDGVIIHPFLDHPLVPDAVDRLKQTDRFDIFVKSNAEKYRFETLVPDPGRVVFKFKF